MYLVPTLLGQSRIHGIGVFAAQPIARGAKIWEFTPGVDWKIPRDAFEQFPQPFRDQLRHWSYLNGNGVYVLCGDNAKFMNHSEEPNCDDDGETFTIARRDIAVGEELTCDYRTFDAGWRDDPLHQQP